MDEEQQTEQDSQQAPAEGVPQQAPSETLAAEPETIESLKARLDAVTQERNDALKAKGELYRLLQKNGLV